MVDTDLRHLRVLIANEKRERLELLAQVVISLGHDVIAREIYVKEVGSATAREHPDVALVGLGSSSDHALELITEIVREASCPVIAILHADDPAYIHEAAKRGVFAYIIDGTHRSGLMSEFTPLNPSGAIPMMVNPVPFSGITFPTAAGSPPRRRCQNP